MLDFLMQLDRELFLFLNGLNASWLDMFMFWASDRFVWIPFYMILLGLCYRYYGWKKLLVLLLMIVVMITISDQISSFLKSSLQRFRPSRDPALEGWVHTVKGYRGGRFGFVSSHASNSMALAIFLVFLLRRHFQYILPMMIVFVFLKSYSRIYLGVHYPGDMLGGFVVGVFAAWVVIRIWKFLMARYFASEKTTELLSSS